MLRRFTIWLLHRLGFDPRGIFSYWDGTRIRHADPMVLARALWAVQTPDRTIPGFDGQMLPFESEQSRALIGSGVGKDVQRGYADVSHAVQQAFHVKPYELGGLTEVECDQLLERFENYLGDLKKNGSPKPISQPATDSADESATSNGLPSGFASTGKTFVLPDTSGLV